MENLQGVCKDCGNGTLNNELDPAFELQEDGDCQYVVCLGCGSTHVDILRFYETLEALCN